MGAEIKEVDFEAPSWDVVKMLRKLADDIESGSYGDVERVHAVLMMGGGDCQVFGFGQHVTLHRTYVELDVGKQHLLSML